MRIGVDALGSDPREVVADRHALAALLGDGEIAAPQQPPRAEFVENRLDRSRLTHSRSVEPKVVETAQGAHVFHRVGGMEAARRVRQHELEPREALTVMPDVAPVLRIGQGRVPDQVQHNDQAARVGEPPRPVGNETAQRRLKRGLFSAENVVRLESGNLLVLQQTLRICRAHRRRDQDQSPALWRAGKLVDQEAVGGIQVTAPPWEAEEEAAREPFLPHLPPHVAAPALEAHGRRPSPQHRRHLPTKISLAIEMRVGIEDAVGQAALKLACFRSVALGPFPEFRHRGDPRICPADHPAGGAYLVREPSGAATYTTTAMLTRAESCCHCRATL